MENSSQFDSFELQLTQQAQDFLKETAKWAMFLSILGFIGLAFMLLGGLAMFAAGSAIDSASGDMGMMGAFPSSVLGAIYLIMAILYFFPVMYLFKFASNTKQAISDRNSEMLTNSLGSLKSHYKFVGILAIVMIVTYIVGIIVAISVFAGAAAGM